MANITEQKKEQRRIKRWKKRDFNVMTFSEAERRRQKLVEKISKMGYDIYSSRRKAKYAFGAEYKLEVGLPESELKFDFDDPVIKREGKKMFRKVMKVVKQYFPAESTHGSIWLNDMAVFWWYVGFKQL